MNAASTSSPDEVLVLGAGFAGLATASYLAKAGHRVRVLERHDTLGGRARKFEAEGFTFDMGPSWYWMPDVFERYFKDFGADGCVWTALDGYIPMSFEITEKEYVWLAPDGTRAGNELDGTRVLVSMVVNGTRLYRASALTLKPVLVVLRHSLVALHLLVTLSRRARVACTY